MVLGFMLKRGVYYIPLPVLYLYHQFFLLFSHPSCLNWLKFDNQGKSLFHYYDCNAFCKNNPFHPSSEFVGIMYCTLYCTVLKIKKIYSFFTKVKLDFSIVFCQLRRTRPASRTFSMRWVAPYPTSPPRQPPPRTSTPPPRPRWRPT